MPDASADATWLGRRVDKRCGFEPSVASAFASLAISTSPTVAGFVDTGLTA